MRRHVLFASGTVLANNGSGYFPQDIRQLYNVPNDLDGTGQTIGILEFSNGYSLRDASSFWSLHGIAAPKVEFVSVDGTRNDHGVSQNDEEASLDLQWAGAIAPKATLLVYEANGGRTYPEFADAMVATLRYIVQETKHQPSVLSISYGDAESNIGQSAMVQIADLIQQLSAKGVTVCIASGDQGAYGMHDTYGPKVPHADGPATAPFAVAVGGTSLEPNGAESAWTYIDPDNGGATGGGFSGMFQRPAYQSGLGYASRGIPDVAMNADPATGYQIIFQGRPAIVGGTSVSCPVFAAVVALANQRRAQHSLPPLANFTPQLYRQPAQTGFRDITVGNNTFNGVKGYDAGPGWDACTGWGSINATQFIDHLASAGASGSASGGATPSASASAGANWSTATATYPRHPVVHLTAFIKTVEQDEEFHGVFHHQLIIREITVIDVQGGPTPTIGEEIFCAIRYGDGLGLPGPLANLRADQPIELQGEYIDKNHAYPSIGNPSDPVLHYTHHPVGFVVYQGRRYE